VYSLTRAILANRYSRNAFFGYCIGLHFLVGVVLYWLATAEVFPSNSLFDSSMRNMLDGLLRERGQLWKMASGVIRSIVSLEYFWYGLGSIF
jgi:CASP C terminal